MLATLSLNGLVHGLSPLLAHQSFEVGKYHLMLSLCLAKLSGRACKKNSSAHIDFLFVQNYISVYSWKAFPGPLGEMDSSNVCSVTTQSAVVPLKSEL